MATFSHLCLFNCKMLVKGVYAHRGSVKNTPTLSLGAHNDAQNTLWLIDLIRSAFTRAIHRWSTLPFKPVGFFTCLMLCLAEKAKPLFNVGICLAVCKMCCANIQNAVHAFVLWILRKANCRSFFTKSGTFVAWFKRLFYVACMHIYIYIYYPRRWYWTFLPNG